MTRRERWLLVAALGLVGIAGALFLTGRSGSGSATSLGIDSGRTAQIDAFAAAYPVSTEASGIVREFDFVAAPTTLSVADGLEIEVWAYNGAVPGPELRVELGDTVVVNLDNQLPQATSIHWHGVRVPNAMDGVPGVNQDPIAPGESFRYEFTPKDAGTFWYHSHNRGSEQIERGLYGSIVVVDPSEPVYDHDLVWMIDDWLLDGDGSLNENFNAMHDVTHNGRWGNLLTVNGVAAPEAVIRQGDRIRLRMVNAANARVVAPVFEGVAPVGVAVDGMLAREPFDGQGFVLAPGNRLDVEFVMPDEPVSVAENFNGEGYQIATLIPDETANHAESSATYSSPSNPALPESALFAELGVDHEYSLDFVSSMMMSADWGFNGRTFDETDTLTVDEGGVYTFRLRNDSQALHPIHFHGQFFMVTGIDSQPVDEGHLRDTVLLFPQQTVDIALRATDAGLWAVHCHIQEHADAGMMTLLEVS
ncbi:MAG: multicopper oxidase family protein [Acidimicrobiia bacterium]|nr:multicopper oxidase family protein [Acidimicrobiia bacterium]